MNDDDLYDCPTCARALAVDYVVMSKFQHTPPPALLRRVVDSMKEWHQRDHQGGH